MKNDTATFTRTFVLTLTAVTCVYCDGRRRQRGDFVDISESLK